MIFGLICRCRWHGGFGDSFLNFVSVLFFFGCNFGCNGRLRSRREHGLIIAVHGRGGKIGHDAHGLKCSRRFRQCLGRNRRKNGIGNRRCRSNLRSSGIRRRRRFCLRLGGRRRDFCRAQLAADRYDVFRRRYRTIQLGCQCAQSVQFVGRDVARNIRNQARFLSGRCAHREWGTGGVRLGCPAPVIPGRSRRAKVLRLRFFGLFLRGRKANPILPSGVGFVGGRLSGPAVPALAVETLNPGHTAGEASAFGLRHHPVFQASQGAQQFAGFERLDDEGIGVHPACFFRLERLQLAHGEQNGDAGGLRGILQALAHFQPAVAGHVDVQHNQVGLVFAHTFQGGRPVIDRDHLVTGVGQDLSPHVLGCHTVIREQYLPRQGAILWSKGEITRNYRVAYPKSMTCKQVTGYERS